PARGFVPRVRWSPLARERSGTIRMSLHAEDGEARGALGRAQGDHELGAPVAVEIGERELDDEARDRERGPVLAEAHQIRGALRAAERPAGAPQDAIGRERCEPVSGGREADAGPGEIPP